MATHITAHNTLRDCFSSWTVADALPGAAHGTVECCVTGDAAPVQSAVWTACGQHAMLGDVARRWAAACHAASTPFTCPACRAQDPAMGVLLRTTRPHAGNSARIAHITAWGGFGDAGVTHVSDDVLYHAVRTLVTLLAMLGDTAPASVRHAVVTVMHRLLRHMPLASRGWYTKVLHAADATLRARTTHDAAHRLYDVVHASVAGAALLCVLVKALRQWRAVDQGLVARVLESGVHAAAVDRLTAHLVAAVATQRGPRGSTLHLLRWMTTVTAVHGGACTPHCARVLATAVRRHAERDDAGAVIPAAHALVGALHAVLRTHGCNTDYTAHNAARFALQAARGMQAVVDVFCKTVLRH